ncbi:MAG: FtsW/RodA/SpoVE family cell cycle protein [Chlamydiota bacterium]
MWNLHYLYRIDFRMMPILLGLMTISLLVIATTTCDAPFGGENIFFTHYVKNQLKWFGIGTVVYLALALFDYRRLREWAWIAYFGSILLLLGLFFTASILKVHRWYRIPVIHMMVQPSECAKLALVLTLSWFLEKKGQAVSRWSTCMQVFAIVLPPFLLILKQPDLGSALVLLPMTLGMLYFGGIHRRVMATLGGIGMVALVAVLMIFLGFVSHEKMRPIATTVLKEYQYERLNPDTEHQKAAKTAIALGGYCGSGWKRSAFTARRFLPMGRTDSVFPAFVEEFGLIGAFFLLLLFFALIYCSFRVTAVARDHFGRVLAAGISVYLAVHVVVNMGMMCGFLPITGVPLVLVSYGGSSVLLTMSALGILQSIYVRRFMF